MDKYPFYVCEGSSRVKQSRINCSEYLRVALERLKDIEGDMVLYGVSLADKDGHIWETIAENRKLKKLFISYHNHQKAIKQKARRWFRELYKNGKIGLFPSRIDNLNRAVFHST